MTPLDHPDLAQRGLGGWLNRFFASLVPPAVESPAVSLSLKGFGMLVLSRRKNERIVFDVPGYPPLEVCVVEIRGDKVRLGIQAPQEIGVDRSEIYDRKHAPADPASPAEVARA